MDFLRGEPIFGLKNREPEPDPGGPQGTPGYPRVCSYVRMSILVPLDRNIDNTLGWIRDTLGRIRDNLGRIRNTLGRIGKR